MPIVSSRDRHKLYSCRNLTKCPTPWGIHSPGTILELAPRESYAVECFSVTAARKGRNERYVSERSGPYTQRAGWESWGSSFWERAFCTYLRKLPKVLCFPSLFFLFPGLPTPTEARACETDETDEPNLESPLPFPTTTTITDQAFPSFPSLPTLHRRIITIARGVPRPEYLGRLEAEGVSGTVCEVAVQELLDAAVDLFPLLAFVDLLHPEGRASGLHQEHVAVGHQSATALLSVGVGGEGGDAAEAVVHGAGHVGDRVVEVGWVTSGLRVVSATAAPAHGRCGLDGLTSLFGAQLPGGGGGGVRSAFASSCLGELSWLSPFPAS